MPHSRRHGVLLGPWSHDWFSKAFSAEPYMDNYMYVENDVCVSIYDVLGLYS